MANQNNKTLVDTVVDTQKKVVDTMVENTKKMANGNVMVNEAVEKGSEWYKNWLEGQQQFYTQATQKAAGVSGSVQDNASKMNEFYQNWFNNQTNWAKQLWEMNMNYFKSASGDASQANPAHAWNNMAQQWTNWMSNMNNTAQWMNAMQQWNNMFNADGWKKGADNWTALFNQYNEILNSNFARMQENMQNGTAQDAYRNMLNASEGFTRFYEMWTPMWKSIQEKTFNMDVYKQWMNPASYQEMMDKYFGFVPETSRQYMQQMTGMFQDAMKQAGTAGTQQFRQMRDMMQQYTPAATDIFGGMLSGYNSFYNTMSEAYAPFTKMMTPGQHTKTMAEWQDLANRMAVYNIKNAELQYMMYQQGAKVMDNLAGNVMQKIENGVEINSIMALYQEWMNLSDKTFVTLFESDEYSALMAEVSAMQLKLRKDIELQMEKFLTGVPVATRSEMDELYKTIYDLKKQVRQMEKMMELGNEQEETEEEPKATTRRSTAKKS